MSLRVTQQPPSTIGANMVLSPPLVAKFSAPSFHMGPGDQGVLSWAAVATLVNATDNQPAGEGADGFLASSTKPFEESTEYTFAFPSLKIKTPGDYKIKIVASPLYLDGSGSSLGDAFTNTISVTRS